MNAAAVMRQDIFGRNTLGDPQQARMDEVGSLPFTCYANPVRTHEQLEAAQFRDIHDAIIRVLKTEDRCKAIPGKAIRLIAYNGDGTDLVLRIAELAPNSFNPEWVLGCKNL